MPNMHPITVLAFVLLSAVGLAFVSYFASEHPVLPAAALSADAGPVDGTEVATPNHDPHRVALLQPPTAEPVATEPVATPNHDPHRVALLQPPTAEPVATEPVATPNHDPHRDQPMPSLALNPEALRAEPEPAAPAPSAPAFVATETALYAKDSARLRAAPSTASDVVTKLAADTPLRATARSTDGAWWRVALDGGRTGYVHRTAVTRYRVVETKPPTAPAPVITAEAPRPVSAGGSQGLLDYVDQTMNWLADKAGRGTAPTVVRTEH